jgi:hypothetical protein
MPAPSLNNRDAPLWSLAPTGGWLDREPRTYYVRASNAEEAVTLAVFVAYVRQGAVPRKHAGRVRRALADLSVPGRTFQVLIGTKRGPDKKAWLATEITEITEET